MLKELDRVNLYFANDQSLKGLVTKGDSLGHVIQLTSHTLF